MSRPYVWHRNLHLAFKEKEEAIVEVKRNGILIILLNAEEVKFSQSDVDLDDPHAKSKSFYTCRNWQFAHRLRAIEEN